MHPYVTGIGAITPFGIGIESLVNGLFTGKNCYSKISTVKTHLPEMQIAGEVRTIDEVDLPNRKLKKLINRRDHLSIGAAKLAWEDAQLFERCFDPARTGVFIGNFSTQLGDFLPYFDAVLECVSQDRSAFDSSMFGAQSIHKINPLAAVKVLLNGSLAHIAQCYNLRGANTSIMNYETSGLEALMLAVHALRRGEVDACLVGAVSAPLDPFHLADGLLSGRYLRQTSKAGLALDRLPYPYQSPAKGAVPSEAAVFFMLETDANIAARPPRKVYAQLGQMFERAASEPRLVLEHFKSKLTPGQFVFGQGCGQESDITEAAVFQNQIGSYGGQWGDLAEAAGLSHLAVAAVGLAGGELPPVASPSARCREVPRSDVFTICNVNRNNYGCAVEIKRV